jgi:hypothetical protein
MAKGIAWKTADTSKLSAASRKKFEAYSEAYTKATMTEWLLGWVRWTHPSNEMRGSMEIVFAFFALVGAVALITVLIAAVIEAMNA